MTCLPRIPQEANEAIRKVESARAQTQALQETVDQAQAKIQALEAALEEANTIKQETQQRLEAEVRWRPY